MIKDIQELNFPKLDGKQYATLSQATVSMPDMGEKTISTQLKIDGNIRPDFSYDWEVTFQGEKYIMPLRKPQGSKGNESLNSEVDLTFHHWAIYQLKRWMFVTMQPIETGTVVADKYIASVSLNLGNFCVLFGQVLSYYYGDTITIDLNPAWQYSDEPNTITINHTKIWNVLIDAFHDKYGVRWEIKAASGNDNTVKGGERYVIRVGYPTTEVNHIFEYGFKGGLLKVERQVQSDEICNMLIGRGGSKNLPYRYFKDTDSDNPSFKADPDWIPELANIYFDRLRGATFRSYIQGWKAKHYGGTTAKADAYAPWAWEKGYTDTKFDPVEYVKDDDSIAEYGPLLDGLEDNDEIFPTIQGVAVSPYGRIDEVVGVEEITSDDVESSVESSTKVTDIKPTSKTEDIGAGAYKYITTPKMSFSVDNGKIANLTPGNYVKKGYHYLDNRHSRRKDVSESIVIDTVTVKVYNSNGNEVPSVNIPAGDYTVAIQFYIQNTYPGTATVTVGCETLNLTSGPVSGSDNGGQWKNTWNIWVKNIWGTSKSDGETAEQYAERVWNPILGDREKNEAKVIFSDGMLSVSEDYEFTIPKGLIPQYDTSRSLGGVQSHWRITLGKSDADLESIGLYVPSTMRFAEAGDHFFFVGIDMPHQYVVWGEERVDDHKADVVREKKDIKPSWVVSLDKVRMVNKQGDEAATLISQLRAGNSLRLADKRFVGEVGTNAYETLYLQSITYTYGKTLIPDVEIVLSDEYEVSANPIALLQGDVSAIQRQIGSISNIEQIVRAVGDRLYLRKDGISDRSLSPTQFFALLTSGDFRAGLIGGAGWGFYKDEDGQWVLETDKINARHEFQVNNLVINQITAQGGKVIESAASMVVTNVVETSDGYICYFDQKGGTVGNLFHVDDVAMGQVFDTQNNQAKFYRRRVVAVDVDSITLSKTDATGGGMPENGDVIVHYGNYTDTDRQYVKVRDVIGGGYERYIEGLDSVNAAGVEYYFVGRQSGMYGGKPRWFIGERKTVTNEDGSITEAGEYAEYVNGKLNIKGSLSIGSTIGGNTFEEYIKKVSPPVKQEDIEDFVNNIVNPKIDGIQDQIDGVIETWFYNGVPTLSNYPASGWNTEALKIQHLGDLYYDNDTGTAYRFSKNEQGAYYWNVITDDAITKALAAAQKAQDVADSKRRIFTSRPAPPYDKGDLWVNATYPVGTTAVTRDPENGKYYNDILRCGTSRATGSFVISDWGLSSNYTDDTKANEALERIAGLDYLKNALEQDTLITGGLIMSTLISLGYTDAGNVRHTMAGMNGTWVDSLGGRTIGSWWGGPMVDLFDVSDVRKELQAGAYATSLVRMDGSAYFSNGNIGFRADGSGWLGNELTGIKFTSNGAMTFGSGVTFDVTNVSGLKTTLDSITNFQLGLQNLLVPCDKDGNELSGGWQEASQTDTVNGGIKAKTIKAKVSLFSEGDLVALGFSNSGGGGGGGTSIDRYDGNWTDYVAATHDEMVVSGKSGKLLYDLINVNKNSIGSLQSTQSSLTTRVTSLEGGAAVSVTTTGSGNAITAIAKSGNVITATMGATFLTQHQSLANYVTLNGAQTITGAKTFTAGITASSFVKSGGTSSQFLKADGSVDSNSYLTTGTASSTYVKKSGDTMTGVLTANVGATHTGIKLGNTYLTAINGDTILQNNNAIRFGEGAWHYSQWAGLKYSHTAKTVYLGIADGSIFTANPAQSGGSILTPGISNIYVGNNTTNKVWHAGNDGSGSGLDADLLDGVHASGLFTGFSLSNSQLTATIGGVSKTVETVMSKRTGGYSSMNAVAALGNCMGMTDLSGTSTLVNPNAQTSWHHFINLSYNYESTNMWQTQFAIKAGTTQVWVRSRSGGAISDTVAWAAPWVQLARTTDNVSSATKLQTARKINGTDFDGTANITTTNWGTARNISISDSAGTNTGTAVSVNGSAAVTLKLPANIAVGQLKIGNGYLKWDEANKAFYVEQVNGAAANFYAKGGITALGQGTGGGGAVDFNRLDAWSEYTSAKDDWVLAASLGYNLHTRVTALEGSTGSSVSWSNVTGKPTTLAGYGITDAKIANGVIKLGANSITPLTSHQTIYNLTIQGAGTTIGTFDPNGAAKTINITPANIGAATASHTHSYSSLTGKPSFADFLTTSDVTNKAATLSSGNFTTIATIGGTDITVKMPDISTTDTKDTAGSTQANTKLYLVGSPAQSNYTTTFSNSKAYVDSRGYLYSGGTKVLTAVTKAQVESVLTGNITTHTHSQYLTSASLESSYVTTGTAQTITGEKRFEAGITYFDGIFATDVQMSSIDSNEVRCEYGVRPNAIYAINTDNTIFVVGYSMPNTVQLCIGQISAPSSGPSTYKLYVNGSARATGTFSSASDMSLKDRLYDVLIPFENIVDMPIFAFKWKPSVSVNGTYLGTSAQYWNAIAPIAVQGTEGNYGLSYGELALACTKSIASKTKELENRTKKLESRIKELEERLSIYENN